MKRTRNGRTSPGPDCWPYRKNAMRRCSGHASAIASSILTRRNWRSCRPGLSACATWRTRDTFPGIHWTGKTLVLMRASAEGADLEQQALGLELEIARLARSEREAQRQADLDKTAHRIESERLLREITRAEYRLAQSITAPADSIVARVLVRPGVSIGKGQVVAKLYYPGQGLEAWLYVSSSSARMLQTGQSVQIRLDAYPQEVFGTQTAVVSHVSGVALVPEEVFVPLTLGGPVFEIRANLRDTYLEAYGSEWPLSPGTAFKADILQRQFKLYEWLMRPFLVDADGGNV